MGRSEILAHNMSVAPLDRFAIEPGVSAFQPSFTEVARANVISVALVIVI